MVSLAFPGEKIQASFGLPLPAKGEINTIEMKAVESAIETLTEVPMNQQ